MAGAFGGLPVGNVGAMTGVDVTPFLRMQQMLDQRTQFERQMAEAMAARQQQEQMALATMEFNRQQATQRAGLDKERLNLDRGKLEQDRTFGEASLGLRQSESVNANANEVARLQLEGEKFKAERSDVAYKRSQEPDAQSGKWRDEYDDIGDELEAAESRLARLQAIRGMLPPASPDRAELDADIAAERKRIGELRSKRSQLRDYLYQNMASRRLDDKMPALPKPGAEPAPEPAAPQAPQTTSPPAAPQKEAGTTEPQVEQMQPIIESLGGVFRDSIPSIFKHGMPGPGPSFEQVGQWQALYRELAKAEQAFRATGDPAKKAEAARQARAAYDAIVQLVNSVWNGK